MDNPQTLIEEVRLAMNLVELLTARYRPMKLRAKLAALREQLLAEQQLPQPNYVN